MKRMMVSVVLGVPDNWDTLSTRQFIERKVVGTVNECKTLIVSPLIEDRDVLDHMAKFNKAINRLET